jgi:cytochrome c oxidase subunit 2
LSPHFTLFPREASTIASQVDDITLGLLLLCGGILLLVAGLITTFGILYREGSTHNRKIEKRGQSRLEWGWTVATFVLFLGIFSWAAVIYFKMHTPPPGASEILVVGKQWMWKFQHPSGKRELDELHVPVGVPILLTMTSEDVIHSLYVPEFRIKQDVLPGRYSRLWFEANRIGEYRLFCTQYCGTMHAGMQGHVIVMPQSEYAHWLQTGIAGTADMPARGRQLFTRLGCISCHGTNPGVSAPSLYGIFGQTVALSDGTQVIADENYIRESILNPNAKIVQGYQPIMPSFAGVIGEEEVLDLIAYVKVLKGTPP